MQENSSSSISGQPRKIRNREIQRKANPDLISAIQQEASSFIQVQEDTHSTELLELYTFPTFSRVCDLKSHRIQKVLYREPQEIFQGSLAYLKL